MIHKNKVIFGILLPLLSVLLLYYYNGTHDWFNLSDFPFILISVLLFTFNILSFITGIYYLKYNRDKSFIYTFSVIFIKLIFTFGLIGILIMKKLVTGSNEILPVMSLYIVFTIQEIILLSGIRLKE